ncbi:MAG: carboxypeptidase-like regulatory domain-containing protein [Myroides sp.]
MKNTLFLFVCTLFTQIITAQNINLQISDSETKDPIDFATVLLPDHKKSFVSNEKGIFMIDTNKYKLPLKVIVEQFGFEKQEITLQNNTSVYNIYLNPATEVLQELIIPPANAKIKERTYGRTNEESGQIQAEDSTYSQEKKSDGAEFGMIITTNNKLKRIKKLHWHINTITFRKAVYSLQFYEVKNGKPSKRIYHPYINFTLTNKNTGWIVLNLNDYNIYIDGHKKIAVTLKLLQMEFEKNKKEGTFTMNVGFGVGNNTVARESQFEEWMKFPINYPFYITVDSYE